MCVCVQHAACSGPRGTTGQRHLSADEVAHRTVPPSCTSVLVRWLIKNGCRCDVKRQDVVQCDASSLGGDGNSGEIAAATRRGAVWLASSLQVSLICCEASTFKMRHVLCVIVLPSFTCGVWLNPCHAHLPCAAAMRCCHVSSAPTSLVFHCCPMSCQVCGRRW